MTLLPPKIESMHFIMCPFLRGMEVEVEEENVEVKESLLVLMNAGVFYYNALLSCKFNGLKSDFILRKDGTLGFIAD
jgi:hypothetical protein